MDRRLKTVCEQFIADTSGAMLGPVTSFNTKVASFMALKRQGAESRAGARLASQPWADTNIVSSCVAETVRLIKQNVSVSINPHCIPTLIFFISQVPNVQRKMQIYLANNETEFILFRPVRRNSR